MSNYQKKDGDISVFTNQNPTPNSPRWKGNLLLNGQEYSVSLWVKNGAKGEFLAGSVQPKQAPVPAPDHFNYPQSNPNSADYYAGKPKAESHNNLNIQDNGSDLPF